MPRDNGHHSTGKGKGKSKGLVESLDTMNIQDYHDPSAPRSGPDDYPYYQPGNQQYQQDQRYPVGNNAYTYHSSSADTGVASTSTFGDVYEAYPNALSTGTGTSTSVDGFYDSNASFSMNAPTSPSSVYSYGASSSVGSYASSHASTVASSAPPRRDPSSVDDRIMGLRPTQKRYELPCEFLLLTGCRETFQDGEETAWMEHVEGHLQGKFPTKLQCWFCETLNFDARHFCGDKPENFRRRMEHIREHIVGEGDKAFDMRPDGGLIRHLRHERIISSREYEAIMDRLAPKNVPPVPGGWHVERIEEVEEEPYSTYRDKKKKGRPESSKKKGSRK